MRKRAFGILVVLAMLAVVFGISCNNGSRVSVSLKLNAKSAMYVGESMPVSVIAEWNGDQGDNELDYSWELDNERLELDRSKSLGVGRTINVIAKSCGVATIKVSVNIVNPNGRVTPASSAPLLKEIIVSPRVDLKSADKKVAVDFLPSALRQQIETVKSEVRWSSSDVGIATIDPVSGEITPVSKGWTVITAEANGSVVTSFRLNVVIPVERIEVEPEHISLLTGEEGLIKAKIYPEDASETQVVWRYDEKAGYVEYYCVDDEARLKGKKAGTEQLVVTSYDGSFTATATIEVSDPVIATGVALSSSSLSLMVGGTASLSASVIPADALNQAVEWRVSDNSVLEIVPSGNTCEVRVLRLPPDESVEHYVEAYSTDGPSSRCKINFVKVAVNSVEILGDESFTLPRGEKRSLSVSLLPLNADDKSIVWTSTASEIVSVDANGNVEVLRVPAVGEQNPIVVTATSSSGKADSVSILVEVPVTNLYLRTSDPILFGSGNIPLDVSIYPENTTWSKNVLWTVTEGSDIISVNDEGVVSATGPGFGRILATLEANDNIKDMSLVYFVQHSSSTISGHGDSIEVLKHYGESLDAVIATVPDLPEFSMPVWSSNRPDIVSVSDDGYIKALKGGTAVITASGLYDHDVNDTLSVTVIDVQDVSFNVLNRSVAIDGELDLSENVSITVVPDSSEYKELVWTSEDSTIAEVNSSTGVVRGKKLGSTKIWATSSRNESKKGYCQVTVGARIDGVALDKQGLELRYGESDTLHTTVTATPDEEIYCNCYWTSSPSGVVSLSRTGGVFGEYVVKALSVGTTRLTAFSSTDSTKYAVCDVVVRPVVRSLFIDGYDGTASVKMGNTLEFSAIVGVQPYSSPDSCRAVSWWISEGNDVGSIDSETGVFTPLKPGTATVMVKSVEDESYTDSCVVTVKPSVSISFEETTKTVYMGDSVQLQPVILANPAGDTSVTWSSSEVSSVSVDGSGNLTLLEPGKSRITVTSTKDSDGVAYCDVILLPKYSSSLTLSVTTTDPPEYLFGDKTLTLQASNFVNPNKFPYNRIEWTSTDEDVAVVVDGVVYPMKTGECDIVATAAYSDAPEGLSNTHHVKVDTKGEYFGWEYTISVPGGSYRNSPISAFRMAKYEINNLIYDNTIASYDEAVADGSEDDGYVERDDEEDDDEEEDDEPGAEVPDDPTASLPKSGLKWHEVLEFCNKMSYLDEYDLMYVNQNNKTEGFSETDVITLKASGNGYRVPTKLEWEYAAAGGQYKNGNSSQGPRYTYAGSDSIDDVAWYNGNSESAKQTVGTKSHISSQYDLYDMSGNVSEWCWDDIVVYEHLKIQSNNVVVSVGSEPSYEKTCGTRDVDVYDNNGERLVKTETHYRAVRGGAYNSPQHLCEIVSDDNKLMLYKIDYSYSNTGVTGTEQYRLDTVTHSSCSSIPTYCTYGPDTVCTPTRTDNTAAAIGSAVDYIGIRLVRTPASAEVQH